MKRNQKLPRGVFRRDSSYWIQYYAQGRKHREKVGPFLDMAKRAVEKRRSEVREGKFFPEKVNARPVLFGEMAKAYVKLAKARLRAWRDAEDHVKAFEPLNDAPIADLTPARLGGGSSLEKCGAISRLSIRYDTFTGVQP